MFWKRSNYRMPGPPSAAPNAGDLHNSLSGIVLSGCAVSDVGCVRLQNQDNFLLLDQLNEMSEDHCCVSAADCVLTETWVLAGVFDGISSTGMAQMASREVAAAFRKAAGLLRDSSARAEAERIVRNTFVEINARIADTRQGGTTATLLCANRQCYKIFQLGDTRAYLFRKGQLYQLTRDQTLAQLKLDAGLYSSYSPEILRESHILTDYIGRERGGYPVESDWIPILPGDHILLCSDGLYELCSDKQMTQILQENLPTEAQTENMIGIARENGGPDNITCVILRLRNREGV